MKIAQRCQQHIDESFKDDMVAKENSKSEKLNSGMGELLEELKQTQAKINIINEVNQNIQTNRVEIAKENSSLVST